MNDRLHTETEEKRREEKRREEKKRKEKKRKEKRKEGKLCGHLGTNGTRIEIRENTKWGFKESRYHSR